MKKLLALLLAALLACSMLVACDFGSIKEENTTEETTAITYDLDSAATYVESLYKEDLSVTSADFDVVSQVMIAGVTYQIDWSVDTDKVTVGEAANGIVVIDVDEKSPEEVEYKLTATIKAGDGTTKSVTFKLTVPLYDVNSHEEYMNAAADDILTIEGIVVAINSKDAGNKYNHLFIADTSVVGGYYCYSITKDPVKDLGIEVGMTVKVTGPMAPYSGMQEIKGGQVAIVDKTIKTVEPVDITEAFAAGSNLGVYVGLPVTIKGVELGAQDLEKDTSQYLYFSIGEKQGYVRTYVTDFPTTLKADDKATIDADHAEHFGYTADVTGILVLYNSAPYLIPMSTTPFTNYTFIEKTPEEKVEAELDDLKIDATFSSDTVIDLLSTGKYYDDVTLTWTTDDTTGAAAIADGKLTLVIPDEALTVKVTVTATCGEATATKTFEIKLSKNITSIKDIIAIGSAKEHNTYTEEKYLAGGIIVEIQNETYGNMVIKDESGETILIYGTFINGKKYGEAEGTKPVVGDYVVVMGVVGQYNDKPQIKNADILSFTAPSSIKDASDAGAAQEHNTYTENKYLVSGVITEIANSKYGNLYIEDAEGNSIYLYGLYTQDNVRFDGMTTQPAVGDTITVLGAAGKYNDSVQLKDATLVGIAVAEEDGEDTTVATDNENTEGTEDAEDTEGTNAPEGTVAPENTNAPEVDTPEDTNAPEVDTPEDTNAPEGPVTPEEPGDEATAYTMQMVKADGVPLYFNGSTADVTYRLATTTNAAEAVPVYLEAVDGVEGAYRLYFMNGDAKTYIRVYEYTDDNAGYGKGSLELTTTVPTEYLTYDATARTYIYTADADNSYYIGTYGDYTTFSVSNTYYITGDKAADVDVSQFPARLVEVAE